MEKIKVHCQKNDRDVEIELSFLEQPEVQEKNLPVGGCPKFPLSCGTCDYS
jgi:hypothetical protein